MREIPFSVFRGFFMGAADIVPGISGSFLLAATSLLIALGVGVVIAFNEIGKRFEHRTTADEIEELQSV